VEELQNLFRFIRVRDWER